MVLEYGSADNTYPGDQASQREADSWRDSAEPRFAASDHFCSHRIEQ